VQIIRTLIWIVVTAVWVAFMVLNWSHKAPVIIWPLENNNLQFDWPVGFIALVFFVLGFLPMWLYHRAGKWRWQRRVSALENSVRTAAAPPPPIATSTQLEALNSEAPTEAPSA
jgi:hypothetical protein